jgi:hypothetical protein
MKRLAITAFSFLFFLACANTYVLAQGSYTAASCNQSDVNAVINGPTHNAVDGDTIKIPAGNCTWSSGITVPSNIGITVIGNGTPNSTPATSAPSSSCASGTSITLTGGITAFRMTPAYGNSTSRLSCMTAASGTGSGIFLSILGTCTSSGCPNLRMDNITFNNWAGAVEVGNSYGITAVGDMFGVIDHNTINGASGNYLELVEQSNASYLGVGYYGDNSWAQPENYGSANFLFFENNTFNDAGTTDNEGNAGGIQSRGGGRVVARFNTFNITDNYNYAVNWHGTESNGRPRSGRAFEYYGNAWNCNSPANGCAPVVNLRGGTGLMWGNNMSPASGSYFSSALNLYTYRTEGNPSGATWGPCDGSTGYDTNDGTTYYSGTISSYTSVSGGYQITVSGSPGWTANQWFVNGAPYSAHDVTQSNGAEISANGSNTLTVTVGGGPGAYTPANGDSIQILRATACIDQAGGRATGTLYSSSCNPAGTGGSCKIVPANEISSPAYVWDNAYSTAPGTQVYSDTFRVIANRDYYTENVNQAAQTGPTSPFNGTSGMGHGTMANQPTTCTTGVGYWATDQGNWNQSGSGGQGELFLCTAANTWTLFYTPYTYPNPLTGTAPQAPTGLQATVN